MATNEFIKQLRSIGKYIRILYVEDDKMIAQMLQAMLHKILKGVDHAANGKLGLEQYQKESYDLVITDIAMPEMNGIEMIKAIKKINPEQVIVVTSAYNDTEYLTQMIDAGVDKFIMKPIEFKPFVQKLSRVMIAIYNDKRKRQLERKVLEQASEMQIILEHLPSPVIVVNGGTITYANKNFLESFGVDYKDLDELLLSNIMSNDEITTTQNRKIMQFFEQHNGMKVKAKIDQKDRECRVMVSNMDGENKRMLCLFDVATVEKQITASQNEEGIDPLTGLLSRSGFGQAYSAIEHKASKLKVICFGVIHIDHIIKKYGVKKTPQIYQRLGRLLTARFKDEIENHTVLLSRFGTNRFVLASYEEIQTMKGQIDSVAKSVELTGAYAAVKESISLDKVVFELAANLDQESLLDEIENRFFMLKE